MDKAPISTHPAFPAIVALWFACLLGLGSLVLPSALLERLVAVTGIAAVVPAAEPPLGSTAHALIALVGALAGAAAGLLLARQVARSQEPQFSPGGTARADARECRPIAAHAELGEEGFEWLDFISEHGSPIIGQAYRSPPETFAPPADGPRGEDVASAGERGPDLDDWWRAEPAIVEVATQATGSAEETGDLIDSADDLRRDDQRFAMFDTPVEWFFGAEPDGTGLSVSVDASPPEELGLVQLAGRLGAAIERRRTLKASGPDSVPTPAAAPFLSSEFEAAQPEDAARARASFFGSADAFAGGAPGRSPDREHSSPAAMKNPFSGHEEFVPRAVRMVDHGPAEPVVSSPFGDLVAASFRPSASSRNRQADTGYAPTGTSEEAAIPANSAHLSVPPRNRIGSGKDLRAALATLQRISGAA